MTGLINPLSNSFKILQRLAPRHGWHLTSVDAFSGSLIRVTDSKGRSTLVGTGRHSAYPINSATATGVAKDKAHTASVLQAAGLKTPETELVFLDKQRASQRPKGREKEDAATLAKGLGYPLIVKPNDGANGVHVFCVADETGLLGALETIGTSADTAVIQQPLEGDEHRLFVLDGIPLFIHKKALAPMVVDAPKTLEQIFTQEDTRRQIAGMPPLSYFERSLAERALEIQGIAIDQPIPAGTPLQLGMAANLAQDGLVSDLRTEFTAPENAFCKALYAAFGLRVMGVDIMGAATDLSDCMVLEVNGNPGIKALDTFNRPDLADHIFTFVIEESLSERGRADLA